MGGGFVLPKPGAAKPQPKKQAQTNNPIATKNTKKASSHMTSPGRL
jgi:hypothetical protein